jgi:2-octaprenyl-6-methoxyphenol hydroxylase
LRVALVEAVPARANHQPSYDERNLALARATVNALTALGVWRHVSGRATPIRRIHVSRQGEFGAARFEAARHRVEACGAVWPARELGNGLLARLDACKTLVRHAPATLTAIEQGADAIEARLVDDSGERVVAARLVVGADGTGSFVRSALGIETTNVDYAQTAFVTTVTPQRQLDGCATSVSPRRVQSRCCRWLIAGRASCSRFRPATLRASRRWTMTASGLLHERFGWRLDALASGRRVSYPLQRVQAMR